MARKLIVAALVAACITTGLMAQDPAPAAAATPAPAASAAPAPAASAAPTPKVGLTFTQVVSAETVDGAATAPANQLIKSNAEPNSAAVR